MPCLQTLLRARFRKKVELEPVERWLVWGGADAPLAALETPAGLLELVDREPARCDPEELFEIARIEAGMARFGLRVRPPTRCRRRPAWRSGG